MKKKLSTLNSQLPTPLGFSLIEYIVAISLFTTLIGISMLSFLNIRQRADVNTTVETIVTDMRYQQIKAMVGDREGSASASTYGIYFEPSRYVLFHGSSYNPSDEVNKIVNLEEGLQFVNILFPSSELVFSAGSGEVSGYVAGSDSITLKNTRTNDNRLIRLNRFGVVTQIN